MIAKTITITTTITGLLLATLTTTPHHSTIQPALRSSRLHVSTSSNKGEIMLRTMLNSIIIEGSTRSNVLVECSTRPPSSIQLGELPADPPSRMCTVTVSVRTLAGITRSPTSMMTNTLTAATKTKADKVQGSQDLVEGESLFFCIQRIQNNHSEM